jgi:hypothetical protein
MTRRILKLMKRVNMAVVLKMVSRALMIVLGEFDNTPN